MLRKYYAALLLVSALAFSLLTYLFIQLDDHHDEVLNLRYQVRDLERQLSLPFPSYVTFNHVPTIEIGDSTSHNRIVLFIDYQCPFCRQYLKYEYERIISRLVDKRMAQLFIVNTPAGGNLYSMEAAQVGLQIYKQGKFEGFITALNESTQPLDDTWLDSMCTSLNLDYEQVVQDSSLIAEVTQEQSASNAVGVKGTPSILINNQLYLGGLSTSDIERILSKRKDITWAGTCNK